jgi:hypothetical protein
MTKDYLETPLAKVITALDSIVPKDLNYDPINKGCDFIHEQSKTIRDLQTKLECHLLIRYNKHNPDEVRCVRKGIAECENCYDYYPNVLYYRKKED